MALSPHSCSLPVSRRPSCLFLSRSTRETPPNLLQASEKECSPSLKQEQRLVGLPIAEIISVIEQTNTNCKPGYWNKVPFICKSWWHQFPFLCPVASSLLSQSESKHSLKPKIDFLVVGVAVRLEFWWMESELKSGFFLKRDSCHLLGFFPPLRLEGGCPGEAVSMGWTEVTP